MTVGKAGELIGVAALALQIRHLYQAAFLASMFDMADGAGPLGLPVHRIAAGQRADLQGPWAGRVTFSIVSIKTLQFAAQHRVGRARIRAEVMAFEAGLAVIHLPSDG